MTEKLPVQNVREISGHVFDNSGEESKEFFGGQLHDFAVQINYPYDLLFFTQDFLTDVDESLVEVTHHRFFVYNFVHFVHLDWTYPVHHYQIAGLVPAAYPVLVYLFQLHYLVLAQMVLNWPMST